MRISANLGFLFTDLPLTDAIRAAKRAGFDAVEMHWPYDVAAGEVAAVLRETGLPLLSINTWRGGAGESGLSALPGREGEARAAIDRAVAWAAATGCRNIHVLAGTAAGAEARATFLGNLRHAAAAARPHGIGLLVEPLNPKDAPGYFLRSLDRALEAVDALEGEVRLMFDCYHIQLLHGNLLRTIAKHLPLIGHVQFAAVPDRAEPDHGEIDYQWLLRAVAEAGYTGFFGAEYRPASGSFGWLEALRQG